MLLSITHAKVRRSMRLDIRKVKRAPAFSSWLRISYPLTSRPGVGLLMQAHLKGSIQVFGVSDPSVSPSCSYDPTIDRAHSLLPASLNPHSLRSLLFLSFLILCLSRSRSLARSLSVGATFFLLAFLSSASVIVHGSITLAVGSGTDERTQLRTFCVKYAHTLVSG